jgi:hypothetical protein
MGMLEISYFSLEQPIGEYVEGLSEAMNASSAKIRTRFVYKF